MSSIPLEGFPAQIPQNPVLLSPSEPSGQEMNFFWEKSQVAQGMTDQK